MILLTTPLDCVGPRDIISSPFFGSLAPGLEQAESIFEEILYLPEIMIPQAAASLRQLLHCHAVVSGYLKAFEAVRLPQQLQVALRHIWAKCPPNQALLALGAWTRGVGL